MFNYILVDGDNSLLTEQRSLAAILSSAGYKTFVKDDCQSRAHEEFVIYLCDARLSITPSHKQEQRTIKMHEQKEAATPSTTDVQPKKCESTKRNLNIHCNAIVDCKKYDVCFYYTCHSSIDEVVMTLQRLLPLPERPSLNTHGSSVQMFAKQEESDNEKCIRNERSEEQEECTYSRKDVNCFVSTRGESEHTSFLSAVRQGLATDKGLYMLRDIPHIVPSQMEYICVAPSLSYLDVAEFVLEYLVDSSIAPCSLYPLVKEAYASVRWSNLQNICPVTPLLLQDQQEEEQQCHTDQENKEEEEEEEEESNLTGSNTELKKGKDDNNDLEVWMQNVWLVELFHGPTAAFKDFALQLFPRYFHLAVSSQQQQLQHSLQQCQEKLEQVQQQQQESSHEHEKVKVGNERSRENYVILTATSGDTGVAAISGFLNAALSANTTEPLKEQTHTQRDTIHSTPTQNVSSAIKVMVLYPLHGVSPAQQLQMVSFDNGYDVRAYGIEANFDFCQHTVKTIFADEGVCNALAEQVQPPVKLSSANSINWGRLIPQVVYYFWAYRAFVQQSIHYNSNNSNISNEKVYTSTVWKYGNPIDVVVPCGNFGNILAAYMAKLMGLPLRKLIVASNENDVLYEFVTTGNYDIRHRTLTQTASPSIDILKASNVERFLFLLSHGNATLVKSMMHDLEVDKHFTITRDMFVEMQQTFCAARCSEQQCANIIKIIYEASAKKRLLDPHTAVAVYVAEQYKLNKLEQPSSAESQSTKEKACPLVIASTAHWSKFSEPVLNAITNKDMHEMENLEEKEQSLSLTETAVHLSSLYDKVEVMSGEHSNVHRHPALNAALNRFTESKMHLACNKDNDSNHDLRDDIITDSIVHQNSNSSSKSETVAPVAEVAPRTVSSILEDIVSELFDFARAKRMKK